MKNYKKNDLARRIRTIGLRISKLWFFYYSPPLYQLSYREFLQQLTLINTYL